ncbi:hypothetical protein [Brevundimonas sp. Root1279]|uniref:hypothetical protein n=1 Tax=Brevundimonas sp. Root1279 TaxID=1736443 RepID=UPI0006F7201B|nr:hypothetical protein [Brevundimonas sp. Root1279]KQW79562.1 hypothetical protein ASC65_13410 [Brevundimonas sp. Root1279]
MNPEPGKIESRPKAAFTAFSMAFVLSAVVAFMLPRGLHALFTPAWMAGAVFEWGLGSPPVTLIGVPLVLISLVASAIYGARTQRVVPIILPTAAVGVFLGVASFALAHDQGVAVWSDRIEIRDGGEPRIYLPADVQRVETSCYRRINSNRHRIGENPRTRRWASVDYRLVFADGESIELDRTRPEDHQPRLEWLRRLAALDAVWGAQAERIEPLGSDGEPLTRPACVDQLVRDLSPEDFALASRLLGLTDERLRAMGFTWSEP